MGSPFDMEAYWSLVLRGRESQADAFRDSFLPILRRQSAIAMAKKATSRPYLGYVVFLACKEHWNHLSPADPFPFDTNVRKKDPVRLGMSMEHNDHINSSLLQCPRDLVAFVRETGQTPQMAPHLSNQASSRHPKGKSGKTKLLANTNDESPGNTPGVSETSNTNENDSGSRGNTSTSGSVEEESTQRATPPADSSGKGNAQPRDPHVPDCSFKQRLSQSTGEELDNSDAENEDEAPVFHTFGPSALTDLDQWAVPVSSSDDQYREAPKLPTCGPWEIPLPAPMDPKVHVVPHLEDVQILLGGIRIQTTQLPPRLKVELSGMQRAATHLHPDGKLLADLTAVRWKAYRVLLSWAEHLKSRACTSSERPLDVASFVRHKHCEEGNRARDQAMKRIERGAAGGGVMFPGEDYQMPLAKSMQRDPFDDDGGSESGTEAIPIANPGQLKRSRVSSSLDEDNDSGYAAVSACVERKHKRARREGAKIKQEETTTGSTMDD